MLMLDNMIVYRINEIYYREDEKMFKYMIRLLSLLKIRKEKNLLQTSTAEYFCDVS